MNQALTHLGIINIQDEYGTPNKPLRQAMSDYHINPVLDVCTNQANRKFPLYYTIEDDALTKQWDVDFFMNPPYSKIQRFMEYAYAQHKKHNVNGLILTYAKTDTRWWHGVVEGKAETHFIKGRLKFNDESGNMTRHPAPYPSVWIIWRAEHPTEGRIIPT